MAWSISVVAQDVKPQARAGTQILFVCTGNYYRSRFAEALFNQEAKEARLDWQAFSRGLRIEPGRGGISPVARQELARRGVPAELSKGDPQSLTQEDLNRADYVVVMDETEHRPLMETMFLTRGERKIHYWHIPDTARMKSPAACEAMSKKVEALVQELATPATQ